MLKKIAISVLLSMLVAMTAAADDLAVTRASINPESTLPAAPVWISFELKNTADHPVAVPSRYLIEITAPSGDSFLAWQVTSHVAALPQAYLAMPPLAPSESRVIDFPTGSALGDGFFADQRLWEPGTWRFRVVLSSELRDDRLERVPWTGLMAAGFVTAPPVATPLMTLRVEQPVGVDHEAWKALLDARAVTTLNGPKGGELAKQLWDRYGSSRYAPYFGMAAAFHIARNGGEGRFAVVKSIYERVIAIDRDAIFSDDLRKGPALRKALDAAAADNFASAVRATNEARAALGSVAAIATHELTRVSMHNELHRLSSPEELKQRYAETASAQ